MSSSERRAILLLGALAVAGHGAKALLLRPDDAPGAIQLLGGSDTAGSALAHRDSAIAASRPLGPNEQIDLDRADAREIARLPRIGPALARTIVADRAAEGPFGSLEGLDRVPGIGPGLLGAVRGHVSFSGKARAQDAGDKRGGGDAGDGPVLPPSYRIVPGSVPAPSPVPSASSVAPVDLNTASEAQLVQLPGIGPALASRIVAFRDRHGRFAKPEDLERVPGLGPAKVRRILHMVSIQ